MPQKKLEDRLAKLEIEKVKLEKRKKELD